jgi:putative membrane protein
MWHIGDGMAWWMLFGTLFELVVLVAVVFLVVHFVNTPRTDRTARSSDDPLDIAKRRYARGEISRDQFDELRRDLADPRMVGT